MKKFVAVCFYALGVIGGLGWTMANHAWVISAGVLCLAIMAFPELRRIFEEEDE